MFLYLLRAHSPIRSSVPIKPINNTCQFKLLWNAIISGQSFPFHPPLAHGLTKAFYRLKPLHSHSLHFMSNLPSSAFWHLFLGHHFYSWSFLFFFLTDSSRILTGYFIDGNLVSVLIDSLLITRSTRGDLYQQTGKNSPFDAAHAPIQQVAFLQFGNFYHVRSGSRRRAPCWAAGNGNEPQPLRLLRPR